MHTAATSGRVTAEPSLRSVLASPKMFAILVLAAASGYPNQLTESALQAWLKDSGATNTAIGLMSYVAVPYLLKALWAPLVDRYPIPLFGRRRGWMFVTQIALALSLVLLATQNPAVALTPVAACALVIVFCSATQDIAIDAYRTDISLPEERGAAAALTNLGYRTISWLAAAVALVLADFLGWHATFVILGLLMLIFCIESWRAPEPDYVHRPPASLRESILEPLRQLLGTPGALALIGVVVLYKIGDAFSNKLFTPFMMDTGFTKTEIALIAKVVFTASAVGGSVLGGLMMVRMTLVRSMLVFGLLAAVSNLLYCVLIATGKNYAIMIVAVAVEHLAGAMSNVALTALIMALCDLRFSAFQFALLSSLALLPRYSLGYPAGWTADHGGWFVYYIVSFLIGLPGLVMVWWNAEAIEKHARKHE
jgi:MFS transporter, PAT family, beta-lactamase induction signal transducer AmpG